MDELNSGRRETGATYCFRLRFRVPPRIRFEVHEKEWIVSNANAHRVMLRSASDGETIKEATRLALMAKNYGTEEEAHRAATIWRAVLEAAFARLGAGADFGDRGPRGGYTEAGLQVIEQKTGRRVLNDVDGIHVYECEPRPVFASITARGVVGKGSHKVEETIKFAAERIVDYEPVRSLAFDLYSASFFESSADARFLMLMMAIETLIDPGPRPEDARRHVERIIQITEQAELTDSEKSSLIGTLRGLLDESISAAGRRLARTLEPRRYGDKQPSAFFTSCYELRSRLVHGYVPRPAQEEVDMAAAQLEVFAGNLLCGELLTAIDV